MTPVRARSLWRLTARDEFARGVGTASQPARASSSRTHRSTRPALRLACAAALASSLAACAAPADGRQDAPLTPIGCFADVVADGEHEDGYSARLWSTGDAVIGLVTVHRGLIGDAPLGVLDDVRHDSATGRISFTAKLTIGLHSCPLHDNVPSRDVLSFDGVLTAAALEGQVRTENRLDSPPAPGDFRRTVMRRDPACTIETYADTEAWRRYWEPVVTARGPNW